MVSPPKATANGYAELAQRLRDWIIDSAIAPGTALPKQTELADRFGVSSLTVGRAMRELQDDGLVVAVRRAGTFVADAPPHLNHFALALPDDSAGLLENRFLAALSHEAARVTADGTFSVTCYHGIRQDMNAGDWPALARDLARRRLAGIMFAAPPFELLKTPAMTLPGLPRAALQQASSNYPNVAKVTHRGESFVHRAFERLADLGCRRIGLIVNVNALDIWDDWSRELGPEYGLELRPEWTQATHLVAPECARRAAHLLLSQHDRGPDGIIITDDNLVEQATLGIQDSGVDVPVIAHTNFPWQPPSNVPVMRLGFDARELMSAWLDALLKQQRGEGLPQPRWLNAVFASEYEKRYQAAVPRAVASIH